MSSPPKSEDPELAVAPQAQTSPGGKPGPRPADPALADTLTGLAFSSLTPPGTMPTAADPVTVSLPRGTDEVPAAEQDRVLYFSPQTVLGGRYEVRDRLGVGGMGSVYAAHDRLVDQPVALKFLRPSLARDPRELDRLRHEVRLAQTVTHVNVARTYTLEESHGILFIVMELLRGQTLGKRLGEGPIAVPETLVIADGLLLGLAAAHGRGVVHRDIKPTNIILCDDGRVVIMDFGLARVGDSASVGAHGENLTPQTGQLGGTPGYMAPEIVRGGEGDVRGDLYSLGVILFEMLAGQAPFVGASPMDLVMQHVEKEVPSLALLQPSLPAEVVQVVERLLAKEPEARFASAEETRLALDPHSGTHSSVPIASLVAPRKARAPLWLPVSVMLGGAAVLGVWMALTMKGAAESSPPSPTNPVSHTLPPAPDARLSPDAALPRAKIADPIERNKKPRHRRTELPSKAAPTEIQIPVDPAAEKRRRKLDLEE